jgi:hypothetical protein
MQRNVLKKSSVFDRIMPRHAFGDYGVLENVVFWGNHLELANTVGSDLCNVHGISRPETNCFMAFKKKRFDRLLINYYK